jgi:hypothetical protein
MLIDGTPMRIYRRTSIAAVLLTVCQTVYGAVPEFPAKNIAPLYGTWRNAMGKGRVLMSISPKWWTSLDDTCPQRSKYEVISIGTRTVDGEKSVDVIIRFFGARYLGVKAQRACEARMLADDAFTDINLVDQGDAPDAPINAFAWRTCDTLEHLTQPVDPNRPNVKSCGAGGGIMDRVTKRIKPSRGEPMESPANRQ